MRSARVGSEMDILVKLMAESHRSLQLDVKMREPLSLQHSQDPELVPSGTFLAWSACMWEMRFSDYRRRASWWRIFEISRHQIGWMRELAQVVRWYSVYRRNRMLVGY